MGEKLSMPKSPLKERTRNRMKKRSNSWGTYKTPSRGKR